MRQTIYSQHTLTNMIIGACLALLFMTGFTFAAPVLSIQLKWFITVGLMTAFLMITFIITTLQNRIDHLTEMIVTRPIPRHLRTSPVTAPDEDDLDGDGRGGDSLRRMGAVD